MYKGVPQYICQYCGKKFKIRSLKKGFTIEEVEEWLNRARCPYCGKLIRKK